MLYLVLVSALLYANWKLESSNKCMGKLKFQMKSKAKLKIWMTIIMKIFKVVCTRTYNVNLYGYSYGYESYIIIHTRYLAQNLKYSQFVFQPNAEHPNSSLAIGFRSTGYTKALLLVYFENPHLNVDLPMHWLAVRAFEVRKSWLC